MTPPKHQFVSRRGFLAGMAAASVAASPFAQGILPRFAVAAEAPAGLSTTFETWFEVEQPPTVPFEVVQIFVDFPVGARAARHVNGGPAFITVLEGEVTMWIGDAPARAYAAGASFVEPYGLAVEAANPASTRASLLVTYLIPVGSAVSMPDGAGALPAEPPAPSPMPRFQSRLRIDEALPPRFEVGHWLRTYESEAGTDAGDPHTATLLTVVSGEVAVTTGATQQTYTAGQHWIELPGQARQSENLGSGPAVVAISATRPPGSA